MYQKYVLWSHTGPRPLKVAFCLLFFLFTENFHLSAQVQMEKFSVTTSNGQNFIEKTYLPASVGASAFAVYGQANVSKFTGTPSIGISLADVSYRDLRVPLELSYQKGNGIKPGEFPGPVGNGWFLNAGGVITRKSKSLTDVSFPNPQTIPAAFNITEEAGWSTSAALLTDIQQKRFPVSTVPFSHDEFSVSCGGLSGTFYRDYNSKVHFKSSQGEELEVEMTVSEGKTILLPWEERNNVYVPGGPEITDFSYANKLEMVQNPYSFVVTDSRGVKYTFGGTDESIEFSRPGKSLSNTFIGRTMTAKDVEPVSWYLTSVKSPNGYEVKYIYERGLFYLNSTASWSGCVSFFKSDHNTGSGTGWTAVPPAAAVINSSLINPCYLKKIVTPESTVQFYWSTADQQLSYQFRPVQGSNNLAVDFDTSWHPYAYNCNIYFNGYADVAYSNNVYGRFPQKLDYFTVSNLSSVLKIVSFEYTEDLSTRLKLKSVKINNEAQQGQTYSFGYSTAALPPYLSFKTDAYGFYNGNTFALPLNDPSNNLPNTWKSSTWRQSFLNSKIPDETYTQAEILNKVTYPSGGYTVYEYENNRYGRILQNWPASISENTDSAERVTAGLRIKKITSYDAANHIASQKAYFYKKGYATGSTVSSGVLSYIPVFQEEYNARIEAPYSKALSSPTEQSYFSGALQYLNFATSPINPMNYTKSGFISYSEVSEADLDGRHTDATFKNYDNGYADRPAVNSIYDHKAVSGIWKEDAENSMDLERGQILTETVYDAANVKKQYSLYEYNSEAGRFDDNGINQRIMKCYPNPIMHPAYGISLRYIATLAYGYYPYLKKKTTSLYENGQTITSQVNYKYNAHRQVSEQENMDSWGATIKNVQKYPSDYDGITAADVLSSGIAHLKSTHNIGTPIEQAVYKIEPGSTAESLLSASFTRFKASSHLPDEAYTIDLAAPLTDFVPSSVQGGAVLKDPRYRFLGRADLYDRVGNVLQRTKAKSPSEVYLWGYNRTYPIAAIKNASYATVAAALGGTAPVDLFLDRLNPGMDEVKAFLAPLRTAAQLKEAEVTTYSYTPLVGISTQTDSKGQVSYYYYDHLQRLRAIRDQKGNIVKTYCYNYAGNLTNCDAEIDPIKPASTSKDYVYSPLKPEICNLAGNVVSLQHVVVYRRVLLENEEPDEKNYTDEYLTQIAPTGYYAMWNTSPVQYTFIEDGYIKYYNTCRDDEPLRFTYSSTYPLNSACSDPGLISKYAYITSLDQTIAVGTILGWSIINPDGYYIRNGMIYKVESGEVTEVHVCQNAGIVYHTVNMIKNDLSIQGICEQTNAADYYYTDSEIGIGTRLYRNATLTLMVGPGYYAANGKVYIVVGNGEVYGTQTCQEASIGIVQSHPPFQFVLDPPVEDFMLRYALTRDGICAGTRPGAPITLPGTPVTLYTVSGDFNEPVPANMVEHIYCTDADLEILAPDGYYTLAEIDPGHTGYKMYYLRNGRILFSVYCDEADPPH